MTDELFSAEGLQSSGTTQSPKRSAKPARATKKSAGSTWKPKSSKRSATKAVAKPKRAAKRAKPSKRAGARKRGRPGAYPDKTMVRMPRGWLAALNAKARAKKVKQGEFLRSVLRRAIGK